MALNVNIFVYSKYIKFHKYKSDIFNKHFLHSKLTKLHEKDGDKKEISNKGNIKYNKIQQL